MKLSATALGIVSALVVIGTAAGLWALQHQQVRDGDTAARDKGLEIAVYKTPT